MKFSAQDKKLVKSMVAKFADAQERNARFRAVGFATLFRLLSKEEKDLAQRLLALDPKEYGFRGPFYGIERPSVERGSTEASRPNVRPSNLVRVPKSMLRGEEVHFLPRHVFEAFKKMRLALNKATGEELFVDSGYRSPAYQLVVLLRTLVDDHFQLHKTAQWVAFPGWSEHGAPKQQAIDFIVPSVPENTARDPIFEKTPAYQWLSAHAHTYGFYLSYPRGNKWGVAFEPWHWHFSGNKEKGIRNKGKKLQSEKESVKLLTEG